MMRRFMPAIIIGFMVGIVITSAFAPASRTSVRDQGQPAPATRVQHAFLLASVTPASPKVSGGGASGSGRSACDFRCHAWRWARTQHGKPYEWGGTGPYGYDCSGLPYRAFLRWHHPIPRTTYDMLASRRLYQVRRPRFGDLAFYGSGHVEFWDGRHHTFGAHHSGTVVSRVAWSGYYHPTVFMRIRGR